MDKNANHRLAARILAVCQDIWSSFPQHHRNCSGFVREVAQQLGCTLLGYNANAMCDFMENGGRWQRTDHPSTARELANRGYFVIAAKKANIGSGHVMVVIPGDSRDGYPLVIGGGSVAGRSDGTGKTARDCWGGKKVSLVAYYYCRI